MIQVKQVIRKKEAGYKINRKHNNNKNKLNAWIKRLSFRMNILHSNHKLLIGDKPKITWQAKCEIKELSSKTYPKQSRYYIINIS